MCACVLWAVVCWQILNNWLSKQNKKTTHLICSSCQFPWCKYSHHGQFQATDVMSLNVNLRRDVHNGLLRASVSGLHHTIGFRGSGWGWENRKTIQYYWRENWGQLRACFGWWLVVFLWIFFNSPWYTHSENQQAFRSHLLCAKHCASSRDM